MTDGNWHPERLWTNNVDSITASLLNQEIRDRMRLLGALSWSVYTPEMYNWTNTNSTPAATKGWIQGYYSEFGDLVRFFIVGNMTTDVAAPVDGYSMGWTLPSPAITPGALTGQFTNYIDQSIADTYVQAYNGGSSTETFATNYMRITAPICQVGASSQSDQALVWPTALTFCAQYSTPGLGGYAVVQNQLDDWNNSTYSSYYICSGEYIRSREEQN